MDVDEHIGEVASKSDRVREDDARCSRSRRNLPRGVRKRQTRAFRRAIKVPVQCTRKRARRSERGASALAPGPLPACRGDSPRRKCGPQTCRKSTAALVQQEVEVLLPSPVSWQARASSAEELELQNRPQSQRATSGPREQVLGCQGPPCLAKAQGSCSRWPSMSLHGRLSTL